MALQADLARSGVFDFLPGSHVGVRRIEIDPGPRTSGARVGLPGEVYPTLFYLTGLCGRIWLVARVIQSEPCRPHSGTDWPIQSVKLSRSFAFKTAGLAAFNVDCASPAEADTFCAASFIRCLAADRSLLARPYDEQLECLLGGALILTLRCGRIPQAAPNAVAVATLLIIVT